MLSIFQIVALLGLFNSAEAFSAATNPSLNGANGDAAGLNGDISASKQLQIAFVTGNSMKVRPALAIEQLFGYSA